MFIHDYYFFFTFLVFVSLMIAVLFTVARVLKVHRVPVPQCRVPWGVSSHPGVSCVFVETNLFPALMAPRKKAASTRKSLTRIFSKDKVSKTISELSMRLRPRGERRSLKPIKVSSCYFVPGLMGLLYFRILFRGDVTGEVSMSF